MILKRRMIFAVVALLITAMLAPVQTYAAPRVLKTTLYDGVIKSGNVVYVAGGEGLYKVWLNKNGSKNRSKLIYRHIHRFASVSPLSSMKKQGDYIYAVDWYGGSVSDLIRINVKTGKRKWLCRSYDGFYEGGYALYNNSIYYGYVGANDYNTVYALMNLDGTRARKTTVRPEARYWVSTTKGYYARITNKGKTITTYLKTPRGLYKLGSHTRPY